VKVIREPKLKVTGPIVDANAVESLLAPEYEGRDLWGEIQNQLSEDKRVLVMLDDDPTGCQTVHDVRLCLDYSLETLREAFAERPRALFIVSNSRSLNQPDMAKRIAVIADNVQMVCQELDLPYLMISRSDSTLRGHYPVETDVIKQRIYGSVDGATDVVIPAFFEGGRVTVFDSQWIIQDGNFIPVGQTEFAKDPLFGYRYSYLPHYIREKFSGYAETPDCHTIEVADLRVKGPEYVRDSLLQVNRNAIVIVNALTYRDMEVFVLGALMAEREGFVPMYRSGASFVRVRAGVEISPPLPRQRNTGSPELQQNGGLVIIGSSTQLATSQLEELASGRDGDDRDYVLYEISVPNIKQETIDSPEEVGKRLSEFIRQGKTVVCYTSRREARTPELDMQWELGRSVVGYICRLVESLTVTPRFVVAKGGLTAHEVASDALKVKSCRVVGQVIPGVPEWAIRIGSLEVPYVVFPGNVGTSTSLRETVEHFQ